MEGKGGGRRGWRGGCWRDQGRRHWSGAGRQLHHLGGAEWQVALLRAHHALTLALALALTLALTPNPNPNPNPKQAVIAVASLAFTADPVAREQGLG